MLITGKFHDILKADSAVLKNYGWRSNTIVANYGYYLAALMKKDFQSQVGIEYMAVGCSAAKTWEAFRDQIAAYFFKLATSGESGPLFVDPNNRENWVWAKKINSDNIEYINDKNEVVNNKITNTLKIEITFEKKEPLDDTLVFREFALVSIEPSYNTDRLFMINHVVHDAIDKANNMELTRTVHLDFPVK